MKQLYLLLFIMFSLQLGAQTQQKVGAINGTGSVTATGGACYSMDIEMPVGKNGRRPKVSLVYNSQSGMGIAGIGVNVSGLSVITRGVKDLYHDGTVRGINYDGNDAFYMDGQRLLLDSGVEGKDGAVYKPEGDPFTTIILHNSYNHKADNIWFEVKTKDGSTLQYGWASGSMLQFYSSRQKRNCTAVWYLNSSTDRLGNTVSYAYRNWRNVMYPYSISYDGNSVNFEYEDMGAYKPTSRLQGVLCMMDRRLKAITTKTGANVYRRYELTYNATSDQSGTKFPRLTTVTVSNGAGEKMRPTDLMWNYLGGTMQKVSEPGFSFGAFNPWEKPDNVNMLTADVDGDGKSEILNFCTITEGNKNGSFTDNPYLYVYKMEEESKGKITSINKNRLWTPVSPLIFSKNSKTFTQNYIAGSPVVDYDGDGLSDIILPVMSITKNKDDKGHEQEYNYPAFMVYLGKDIYKKTLQSFIIDGVLNKNGEPPRMAFGDLTNDGRSDIFYVNKIAENGTYNAYLIVSNGTQNPSSYHIPVKLPKEPEKVFFGDYNGDALTDIIILYDGGYKIYFNNGGVSYSGFFTNENAKEGAGTLYDAWRVVQGDFNGDGLIDFFLKERTNQNFYFAFNNGDGTFRKVIACTMDINDQSTSKDDEKFNIMVTDLDGDGMSDVVLLKARYVHHGVFTGGYNEFKDNFVKWLRTKGETLEEVKSVTTFETHDALTGRTILGDFLGRGDIQLMNFGSDLYSKENADKDLKMRLYQNFWFTPSSGKMYSTEDGLDRRWAFKYGALADDKLYRRATDESYPVIDCTPPVHVVKEIWRNTGSSYQLGTQYTYGGFKVHLQGKGALGFATIKTDCINLQTKTETTITKWDNQRFIPLQTRVKTSKGGFSSTSVTDVMVAAKGNNYFSYPLQKTEEDIYGNKAVSTYAYNTDDGYLTREKTDFGGGMIKQTDYDGYLQKGGVWLPTRINARQKHADGAQWFTLRKRMEYNDQGLPVTIVTNSETPHEVTTTNTYKDGNLVTEKVTGHDMPTITKHYDYDLTGRFIIKTYQVPAAEVATYTYDAWGNVLSETDETQANNHLTTRHTYDGWGDETSMLNPDGTKSTQTVLWGKNSEGNMYHVVETATGKPDVTTWYDNWGRAVETQSTGPDGVLLHTAASYSASDKLLSKTETSGKLTTSTQYEYDVLDRVTSEKKSTGSVTTYSYGNRTTTATVNGVSYTKTYDAWGNIKTSKDPAATVTYFYSSNGKPERVVSNGHTVTMTYDAAGYRTSITDPDAGKTSYSYAADGTVLAQTDARGVTLTNTYDELGRLTRQTSTKKEDVSYSYVKDGYGKLQLATKALNGNYENYSYDKYGRIVKKHRASYSNVLWPAFDNIGDSMVIGISPTTSFPEIVIPGGGHQQVNDMREHLFTRYEYNADGLVSKTIYPDSTVAEYVYDSNGFLTQTKVNGVVASRLQAYDGLQTVTVWGGKITHTSTLNTRGFLSNLSLNKTFGGTPWAMTFTYDEKKGNLLSRTGMVAGPELFAYDDLDRLTLATSRQTTNVDYSADGNIAFKTGIGKYSYLPAKPHAVESVDNTAGLISKGHENVSYNDRGLVSEIVSDSNRCKIYYGSEDERFQMMMRGRFGHKNSIRIYYFDDFEKSIINSVTRNFCYIGDGVLSVSEEKNKNLTRRLYYICADHQGSVVRIVDADGNSVFEASYDAWGRQTVTKNLIGFRRGYTGHEMLPEYALVNMNGRVYDPALGRFLSPDPYVQMPDNSQNFNRYSYCLNNPLKYTDPTGELFGIDDAIIAFAAFNMANSMMQAAYNGKSIWKAGALSLMSSAASYGIGEMFKGASMTFGNELLRAGAHGLAGGVFSALDGGNFGQAFLSGAAASGIGSFAQGVDMNSSLMLASTTLMGGVTAWATGGDFLQGAMQGFIIGGLNHMQHDQYDPINDRYSDKVKSRYRMRTDAKYKQKIKSEIEKDGILSFEEAYYWYGYGDGSSITVDASKMDLGRIDIRGRKVNQQWTIPTLSLSGKYNQGLVYGSITVIYKGNNLFEIIPDKYDFDIQKGFNFRKIVRNLETFGAWILHGTGTIFNINFKGLYRNK